MKGWWDLLNEVLLSSFVGLRKKRTLHTQCFGNPKRTFYSCYINYNCRYALVIDGYRWYHHLPIIVSSSICQRGLNRTFCLLFSSLQVLWPVLLPRASLHHLSQSNSGGTLDMKAKMFMSRSELQRKEWVQHFPTISRDDVKLKTYQNWITLFGNLLLFNALMHNAAH